MTIVTSGLQPNERVVTTNQYRLQAGTAVKSASATASSASS
jgi:hypothetical protein